MNDRRLHEKWGIVKGTNDLIKSSEFFFLKESSTDYDIVWCKNVGLLKPNMSRR